MRPCASLLLLYLQNSHPVPNVRPDEPRHRSGTPMGKWYNRSGWEQGHAKSGTLPKEAYTAPNKLEVHEVVQDSSRPDLAPEPHGGPFKMH